MTNYLRKESERREGVVREEIERSGVTNCTSSSFGD